MSTEDFKIIRKALEQAQKLAYIALHPEEYMYAEAAAQAGHVNTCIDEAIASIDRIEAAQPERKVLTDEDMNGIVKHVCWANGVSWAGPFGEGALKMLRYIRDNGYLAPAPVSAENAMLRDKLAELAAILNETKL